MAILVDRAIWRRRVDGLTEEARQRRPPEQRGGGSAASVDGLTEEARQRRPPGQRGGGSAASVDGLTEEARQRRPPGQRGGGSAASVDGLTEEARQRRPPELWAHLVSDSSFEELHDFAARLGLRREWFQGDHYDVGGHVREDALRLGAVAVEAGELVRRLRAAGLRRSRRR